MSNFEVHVSEKIDGDSLSITYVDGKLTAGVTRGDGVTGEDITRNVQHLNGVPQTITEKGLVTLRGEAVIPDDVFNLHFSPRGYMNSRNATAGILQGRSEVADLCQIRFIAYEYHGERRDSIPHHVGIIDHLRILGFRVPEISIVFQSPEPLAEFYVTYDTVLRDRLPHRSDGLVLRVNHHEHQNTLSIVDGRPEWATAIKPTTKAYETEVLEVIWSQGLSGAYTPVARVSPTEIDGSIVQNVSLHNLDVLVKLVERGFRVGAKITIEKSGDIIPKVVDVLN